MGIKKISTVQKFADKSVARDELKINFNFKFWNEPLNYLN